MPLIINTNVSSLSAQRYLGNNTAALNKTMERLTSGYRINRASDDAAGLALSENLRTQIRGTQKALDNVQDGINMLNILDGAYSSMADLVQRMRELAVQAANDTYSLAQRTGTFYDEIAFSVNEIDRISKSTQFNGVFLLNGSIDGVANFMNIQLGPNNGDVLDLSTAAATNPFADAAPVKLNNNNPLYPNGIANPMSVSTNGNAQNTISTIDQAIADISNRRSIVGSLVNRLESAANNLAIAKENFSASESRIRNTDIAADSAALTRNQILQQASAAMLAQANQAPALALQLLKAA